MAMFEPRISRLREQLTKERLDGVLISAVSNITYLTGYGNFSKDEREAYLLIGSDFQYIITDGRYSEVIKKEVPWLKLFERSHKTPIGKLFKGLKKKIEILGIEEDELTVAEHKALKKHFKKLKHFNLKAHRTIKTQEEIKKIEKAGKLGDKAFEHILKKIKLGISERKLAFELEFFIKKHGADLSFPSIVAFGKNSSTPHHQTGQTILGPVVRRTRTLSSSGREGLIILLDFGVKVDDYCSDMTRTIFLGKLNNKQQKIYDTVLKAQQKAIDFIKISLKSGQKLKAAEVDKVARDYIVSEGYPTIPHSLGHGVGLEVHEHPGLSPKSKEELKEGMVFSIEPGIYLEGFGGVRIEDLYAIEKGKLKQLTNSPKKLFTSGTAKNFHLS